VLSLIPESPKAYNFRIKGQTPNTLSHKDIT